MRVLLIAPEAAGVPRLAWVDELTAIACVEGVRAGRVRREAGHAGGGERQAARRLGRDYLERARGAGPAPPRGRSCRCGLARLHDAAAASRRGGVECVLQWVPG